jgi:hypothetical protein
MGRAAQLSLLLWKNYLLQRRKVFITCLEIGLPALFAIILILVRLRVTFNNITCPTVWDEFQVNSSLYNEGSFYNWKDKKWRISFTPNSSSVNELMIMTLQHLNDLCQQRCIIGECFEYGYYAVVLQSCSV